MKININEERLSQIIDEEMGLFGYDIPDDTEKRRKAIKRREAAKKAAETRKANKEKAKKEYSHDIDVALSDDMFGNNPTKKEREDAKKRMMDKFEKEKKLKKK